MSKIKSEQEEKDLKTMKAILKANNQVQTMLAEHECANDIAEAYEEMRKLLAPKLLERMIKARRLEISGGLDAGT